MFTLKLLRKIGKILRGGANHREIGLGFLLGVLWGFIPGFNLTQFLMLFLVLLLNANFGFMLMGLLVGSLACYGLSPLTFEVGYVLISSLQGLFTSLHNTAVIAWMGLDSYCLVGGIPLGIILGLAGGYALGNLVVKTRERVFKLEASEKMQELNKKFWVKALLFIAFGGKLPSEEEQEDKKHPFLRPMGLGLIVASVVIFAILELFLMESILKSQLEKQASRANGSEVNISELKFSMTQGSLEMKGIEVSDASDLSKNMVAIGDVNFNVQMNEILRSRVVIEELKVDSVEFDQPRKSAAKLFEKAEDEKADEAEEAVEDKEGEFDLNTYLAKAGQAKKYFDKIKDHLDKSEASAEAVEQKKPLKVTKQELKEEAQQLGFLNLRARELYQDSPAWLIKKTAVNNIKSGKRSYTMNVSDLCSHPAINGKPTIVDLKDGQNVESNLVLNSHQSKAQNDFSLVIKDYKNDGPIDFGDDTALVLQDGTMNFSLKGNFSAEQVNLPLELTIRDLKVDVRPGKKVLGLDEENAEEILNAMESIDLVGEVMGPWKSLKVKVDYDKLLKRVEKALLETGKKMVKKKIDEEKKKAEAKVRKKADEKLDKAKSKLDDKLKGLFGR